MEPTDRVEVLSLLRLQCTNLTANRRLPQKGDVIRVGGRLATVLRRVHRMVRVRWEDPRVEELLQADVALQARERNGREARRFLWALKDGDRFHLSHDRSALERFRLQERLPEPPEEVDRYDLPALQAAGFTFASFPDVDAQAYGLRVVSQ